MKLSELFGINFESDAKITGIAFDTAEVKRGDLFFCLCGKTSDGHKFLYEAFEKGAVAAVVEKEQQIPIFQI